MPSKYADRSAEDQDDVQMLTFEQFADFESPMVRENAQPHNDPNSPNYINSPPPASWGRLYLMVLGDFGLSFTWLCKFAVATPYFQHTLKAGVILSHLVWIMGPLSGLVVAPIVGVFSDRCTSSFGRRRPFMASGTVFCIIGMTLFANASRITNGNLFAARLLATLAFGVLDFATNVIMFPSRALLGDLLPSEQQHSAQSAAAVVASLAEICGGLYIYSWKDPVTHFGRIFAVASVCLAISCAVSLIVCVEQPLREGWNASSAAEAGEAGQRQGAMALPVESGDDIMKSMGRAAAPTTNHTVANDAVDIEGENEELRLSSQATESRDSEHAPGNTTVERVNDSSLDTGLKRPPLRTELVETVRTALVNFPRSLMPVGIVYGLAWFVWFASLPYYSQWLGVDVLHGDPHADAGSKAALAYERGVSVFSIANVVKASLALIFAAFYPAIVRFIGHIGERVVFSLSFLIFSSVLFACADTHNVLVAASVVALGSMPFIVTQTIPIAIVVQRYPENLASNLGVMNLFCVVAQLIDTLYTGKVAELAGESFVLRIGAIWGFAAALASFVLL